MANTAQIPTQDQIRADTKHVFGVRPCVGQIKSTVVQLEKKSDVVYISGTGPGKTLMFWMPMIYEKDSITILVTALNILGQQTADTLQSAGISAINVTRANATNDTFKDIKQGKYRLVVVNPELLIQDKWFDELWNYSKFTAHLTRFIFDGGHCVSQWGGTFRPGYASLYRLCFLLPKAVQYYVASATLPKVVLEDVADKLRLKRDTTVVGRSNDRWNCRLIVRRMKHSIKSFRDLDFLIPKGWKSGEPLPHKFLVFFNSRKEAELATEYLWQKFGLSLKDHLVWFHSVMTDVYRADTLEIFQAGQSNDTGTWGLMCTDAAGMGLDISDISLVVQWRVPDSLCTLMQRFGRAARNLGLTGTCVLLAVPSVFTDYKEKKVAKQAQQAAKKAAVVNSPLGPLPSSHAPTASSHTPTASKPKGRAARFTKPKKSEQHEVELAMDQFLNADRLPIRCRRRVSSEHFGNNRIDDEEPCCDRCCPRILDVCCDLCNPELLHMFADIDRDTHEGSDGESSDSDASDTGIEPTQKKGRCYKAKPYGSTGRDQQLWRELWEWRSVMYEEIWKGNDPVNFGDTIVVADQVLQCIVDLTHYNKIKTAQDILKQTRWDDPQHLSHKIAKIVNRTHPDIILSPLFTCTPRTGPSAVSALTQTPLRGSGSSADLVSQTPAARTPVHCSACGLVGHNARNKSCPARTVLGNGQNASPSLPSPLVNRPLLNPGQRSAIRPFNGTNIDNHPRGHEPLTFSVTDAGPPISTAGIPGGSGAVGGESRAVH